MSDIEISSELEGENIQITNSTNEIFLIQKNKWEDIKSLISKNIKEIFWKAWIKPLRFEKYEKGILHLSTDSKIAINRAETQYYDTIFFQASIFFTSLKKIQFHTVSSKQKENIPLKKDVQKITIHNIDSRFLINKKIIIS